jgi:hypothetical protein
MAPSSKILRYLLALCLCTIIVYLLPESLFLFGSRREQHIVNVVVQERPGKYDGVPPPTGRRLSGKQESLKALGKHRYRSDGLVEVNLNGPHPIYELISNAEKSWKSKLAHASQSLEEAVEEYRRRYNRAPPKGFDLWYAIKSLIEALAITIRSQVAIRRGKQRSAP